MTGHSLRVRRVARVLVPALVAAGITTTVALADQTVVSGPRVLVHTPSRTLGSVAPGLRHHFRIFARAGQRTARTFNVHNAEALGLPQLPQNAARIAADVNGSPNDAEYVQVNTSLGVWFFPGESGVCVWVPAPASETARSGVLGGGSCMSVAGAEAGRFLYTGTAPGYPQGVAIGLVPNGTSSAEVHVGGTTLNATVQSNVFAVNAKPGTLPAVTLR